MGGPIVQIEGVGNVQFPASMSEDDINQASHKLYTGAGADAISAHPPAAAQPPKVDMQESPFGAGYSGPGSKQDVGGFEGSYAADDPHKSEAMTGAGILAGGAIAAPHTTGAILGSYAINKARQLPVVGPIIDKIPFAEAIPWLLTGGKGKAAPEAEGAGAGAEAEAAPIEKPEPEILKSESISPQQAKTDAYLKTPQGKKFSKIYQQTAAEHAAGKWPTQIESEEQLPRKPPTGTQVPQTSEDTIDLLNQSLARLKKK